MKVAFDVHELILLMEDTLNQMQNNRLLNRRLKRYRSEIWVQVCLDKIFEAIVFEKDCPYSIPSLFELFKKIAGLNTLFRCRNQYPEIDYLERCLEKEMR